MAIYLVQHGKSLSKEVDPEKGLSQEGTAQVKRIAQVAQSYCIRVSKILHSGKKRAKQTAEIFANQLNPKEGVEKINGIAPLDNVVDFAENLNLKSNQMIVGHLPFMSHLISYLVMGSVNPPIFNVQNGGIICLDQDVEYDSVVIKWALMPEIK
ncbi:MAG: phosphohistidine phosphatase SixA [Desulfobacteraceae bacterium]|jgi:phosphohistidine phosphatase